MREFDWRDRIVIDPAICHGKPVIRGTRVLVANVLGQLANGMAMTEIESEYDIAADDIRAAVLYAAQQHGNGDGPRAA